MRKKQKLERETEKIQLLKEKRNQVLSLKEQCVKKLAKSSLEDILCIDRHSHLEDDMWDLIEFYMPEKVEKLELNAKYRIMSKFFHISNIKK